MSKIKSDIEIARDAKIYPINKILKKFKVPDKPFAFSPMGRHIAKINLGYIKKLKTKKNNLVLVTAITPTPAGEGKTTTSVGLCDGLNKIGKKSIVCLREPSLGPSFGMKGGAAGGGYAQVVPMEQINLHFTGDFHAITSAHNLLSALIDNHIYWGNKLNIDDKNIVWKRVMDMNDRALRSININTKGASKNFPREDGFDITVASEVMAIFCLSNNLKDLEKKIGNITIAYNKDGKPVYAKDLKAQGPMTVLLKDAIRPNITQTLENNPAIIHGGPFANIAQGTNTIIATKMGMSLSKYVVTEAGFGADLGAEKFLNIKCVSAGLSPKALVLVATIRALRHHGGAKKDEYNTPSLEKVRKGISNLNKHIENCKKFGLNPVVAINTFPSDSKEEVDLIIENCNTIGVKAVVARGWEKGGDGMIDLAESVVHEIDNGSNSFNPLYEWKTTVKNKINTIAKEIYGAEGVEYSKKATTELIRINELGLDHLPICMAKTQKSFSDNDALLGRPEGFIVTVREFEFAAGAGFIIPILGKMMRMPGLPAVPASEGMNIDNSGKISGLS